MTTIEPMTTPPSGPDGLAALLRTVLDDWVERMCLFNCDANSSCPCAAHKAHTEALAALTAPPALAVDPGWRDIRTTLIAQLTPLDGVLLAWPNGTNGPLSVGVGYWDSHQEAWYSEADDDFPIYPTHWQPLPAPPEGDR